MGEQVFTVTSVTEVRPMFERAWAAARAMAKAGSFELVLRLPTRLAVQNRKMWPMLRDIADQLHWPVNGKLQRMKPEDWKDVLTAAFKQETRIAEGVNGGHVFLGLRTKEMSRKTFAEWIEFLHWFGTDRGVKFSAPSKTLYREITEPRRAA
ncbi:MAG: recombination protein NinB [Gammaproteobacteria bacterium]|nr:recombination protein NinB [Gammaproteobacteria bacterium]